MHYIVPICLDSIINLCCPVLLPPNFFLLSDYLLNSFIHHSLPRSLLTFLPSYYWLFNKFIHSFIHPFLLPSIHPFIHSFLFPSIHPSLPPFIHNKLLTWQEMFHLFDPSIILLMSHGLCHQQTNYKTEQRITIYTLITK